METVTTRLQAICERSKTSPALTLVRDGKDDLTFSFGQVFGWMCRYATTFQQHGISQGDVVLIFAQQGIDAIAAFWGAMLIGAIPSFMPSQTDRQDPKLFWQKHAELCKYIEAKLIVTTRENAKVIEQHVPNHSMQIFEIENLGSTNDELERPVTTLEDLALLQHSSGTTGLKKGVMLSHGAILKQVDCYADTLSLSDDDVFISWLPLYHDMGLVACLLVPFLRGNHLVLLDPFEWVASPLSLFEAIERHRGTLTWLPNFAYHHLARFSQDSSFDLSHMKAFINCSEPCKWNSFELFADAFSSCGVARRQLHTCYAMAEMVFAASQSPLEFPCEPLYVDSRALQDHRVVICSAQHEDALPLLSSGRMLPGVFVEIVDNEGAKLPTGVVGEIALSADFMFSGYYREDTSQYTPTGAYLTRDLGFLHDDLLYVLGRKDDLIITCGKNVYAHAIESDVSLIEGVVPGRVAAFGVDDEALSTQKVAVVAESRLTDSTERKLLRRMIVERVHSLYDITPASVRVVEPGWIVKTTSGKISREGNKAKHLQQ